MSEQNDCEDVGFSRIEDGCRACAPTFVDGKAVYPRIEPRGRWLCCVKCGGSYGAAPSFYCARQGMCDVTPRCTVQCAACADGVDSADGGKQ